MLGWFWSGCIVAAFVACLGQLFFLGNSEIFSLAIDALFQTATLSVEISIGLIGLMAVWLGFFKIAEQAGLVDSIAKLLSPLFCKLMPEVPRNHPALASMTMNLGANALGLDNAATPLGIKAMHDLQSLNSRPDTLSNAQILFLVLNTSSVTVLPVTVFLFRAQQGAAHPTEVFVPILIATLASTLVGLLSVAYAQKLQLFNTRKSICAFDSVSGREFKLCRSCIALIPKGVAALSKPSALAPRFIVIDASAG